MQHDIIQCENNDGAADRTIHNSGIEDGRRLHYCMKCYVYFIDRFFSMNPENSYNRVGMYVNAITNRPIQKYDEVRLKAELRQAGQVLYCATKRYPSAVVISLEPFILVSDTGEMVWYSHSVDEFVLVDIASNDSIQNVNERVDRDTNLQLQLVDYTPTNYDF